MRDGFSRVSRAFRELVEYPVKPGAEAAHNIGPEGRASEVRLIKDQTGRIKLDLTLIPTRRRPRLPQSELLPHEWVEDQAGTQQWLRISVSESRLEPTFQAMIGQTLEEAESDHELIDSFIDVLASWDEVLRSLQDSLPASAEVGLFGELFLLRELAAVDPGAALSSWRGVDNYRHDFVGSNAVEVKTYTAYDNPAVTIHGLHQLEPPIHGALYLVGLHVDQSDQGQRLLELVDSLDKLGISTSELLKRLKLSPNAIDASQTRYEIVNSRAFLIDVSSPGIRASNVRDDALSGVRSLQYRLELSALAAAEIDFAPANIAALLLGDHG